MKTLDEEWSWYVETKKALEVTRRLAKKHWDQLPWEGDNDLARDSRLREIQATTLYQQSDQALRHLDDLAIVVLFSVFESIIRESLLDTLQKDGISVRNPVIQSAIRKASKDLHEGSFAKVLEHVSSIDPDVVEQVRQVRRYRNWVGHGRRGKNPPRLDPRMAYDRLSYFVQMIDRDSAARALGPP